MPGKNIEADFIFKVIVVGDGGVGKTSLILRYTQSSFNENYIKTVGAQFSKFDYVSKDGTETRLFLWDVAGQSAFNFMHPMFFNGANACIVVFDVTRPNSIDTIQAWIDEVQISCGKYIPIVILGNKIDLLPSDFEMHPTLEGIIENNGVGGFFLTSAKTGTNVVEAFESIINELISRINSPNGETQ